jgi:hypothetical protein
VKITEYQLCANAHDAKGLRAAARIATRVSAALARVNGTIHFNDARAPQSPAT